MFYNKMKTLFGFSLFISCLTATLLATPVKVVTVTEDFASITRSVGGDLVEVTSLVKGSRNLHNITPKPSMVIAVKNADLLVRLGMQQDAWIDGLIQVARNPNLYQGRSGYLDSSVTIQKLEVPTGKIDGSMGDVHKYGNPHYWLNPNNGIIIAEAIRDKLSLIDPENSRTYEKNFQTFKADLNQKILQWQQRLAPLSQTQFITYHKVWPYFFDAFGLTQIGELEPLPGIPPTTKHLAELKKQALSGNTSTIVLTANYYPDHVGEAFAKSIHGKHVTVPTNVGEFGISSYSGLFDYIIKELGQ